MLYIPNVLKSCPQCDQIYPATAQYFHKNRSTADGFQRQCKECHSAQVKKHRLKHPEQFSAAQKEYKQRKKLGAGKAAIPKGFKRCTLCKEILPATTEYFHSDRSHADGLRSQCKPCRDATVNRQRAENPEQQKAIQQRFYANNKEKVKANVREYMHKNREKRNAYENKYWRENREKKQAKSHRRKAAKRNLPNTLTAQEWERCLEYWGYRCAACGREPSDTLILSPDHWIALTDSRPDNPGTVATNIVPLCNALKDGRGGCNNSKHKRQAWVWLVEKFGEAEATVIRDGVEQYFAWVNVQAEMQV